MKLTNQKESQIEEMPITQGTTSTDFTKANKALFLKTISSNFSNQSNLKKAKPPNRNNLNKKTKFFSPLKKVENTHNIPDTTTKRKYSIVSLGEKNTNSNSKKSEKIIKSHLIQNMLLPRNINSYTHLIRGKGVGIYAEIDWALRLRDFSHKNYDTKVLDYKDYYYRKNQKTEEIKQESHKITLTENFIPPSFYEDDLKKYKKKIKSFDKSSLIIKLNPNFHKIKHLLYRNKGDHSDFSQFNFATTLRNGNIKTLNKENKKFEVLPVVNKDNPVINTFLKPYTKSGVQNLKKIEKYISKKYEYKYGTSYVGGDKIMKKKIVEDRLHTISGIGETLGDMKYNNYFAQKNIFYNKKILELETNPMCKFELGLRNYDDNDDEIKNKTHRNFRPKKKKYKL